MDISTNLDNSQFQIIGTTIYDPNGQEFIIKGTNMFTWEGINNVDNYLNTWDFNTIRVPNYLLGSYDQPHPAEDGYGTNHKIVDAYTSQGAVVIFDAHDLIGGYYENTEWEILKDYWRDMAQEFKDNSNVWFNLHNEPGNDTANPEQWVNYHRELIDIIRAEGANNLIVIDGEAWGQDYHTQTIASHASEIMAGNENILFSIHVYEQWNSNDIAAYFDTLHSQNIPFIIGEYGSENNGQSTLPATQQMLQAAQEREIGRIVWAAKADDNNDLTTATGGHAEYFYGTNTDILTDLGALVWNDTQRTEDLEQLDGYGGNNNNHTFTNGVFEVDATGQIQFDFLFDGGWFQGELAVFSLEGMETYTPGSIEFIQEAATRALANSEQGHIVLQDSTEGARFSGLLPWENDFNAGEYLGQKTFNMPEGTRFAFMLIQDTTVQEIANNPSQIWQDGKLPIFSIPEANPGTAAEQIVAVDNNGTFAFEDVRVDWGDGDKDYNDVVFQLQGASSVVPSMDELVNPEKDWRTTEVGQNILEYAANTVQNDSDKGTFVVNSTGQVQFDFLFDGGWFQGELAVFSLDGMDAYVPGSTEFIQAAASRALTNSEQGHILLRDRTEGARFGSPLPWEKDFNAGEYLGQKVFTMTPGDRFAFMLIQHTTVQEIADNPGNIWQWGKLPIFSMAEANPNGTGEGQMVAVDEHGTFAFEDVRVDWGDADGDYNDIVFQIKGADGFADSMDELVNSDRDWRNTAVGQELLAYAASTSFNGNTVLALESSQTTQTSSRTSFADSTLTTQEKSSTTTNSTALTIESDNNYQIFQGGEKNDTFRGSKENDIAYGGLGNDRLLGRNNDDMLFGDEGNDLLSGGRGNDILVGGLGNDTLKGGDGSDLFVLANDGGVDLIEDFEIGQDVIQLSGSLQFEDLTIAQGSGVNSNDVMISIIETNQLLAIINDINSEDFTVVDFI
ncbi:MAG: cellulase family glycosylhydrolase [Xenococcaceae cyanobacterium MO_188.B29]|nr:cellulase family glycosylhydrolase [Xenococcaceae cyanobacterium MO_188.B29]